MSRVLGLAVAALVVGAAACGGGSGGGDTADPPASTPTSPAPSTQPASRTAVDAAGDLSEFVCAPRRDGAWDASGVITNSSGRAADYRVTVVVADGPGVSVPGKSRTLTGLTPGTPESFKLRSLPAVETGGDPTCQVEVLRLP